jgi:hypothetical protein
MVVEVVAIVWLQLFVFNVATSVFVVPLVDMAMMVIVLVKTGKKVMVVPVGARNGMMTVQTQSGT